ncbi:MULTISPECIES: hypothetical protein [unclassified Desulfurobacterium]|uniref:hypothetical protein n=1 Tax=Desulfurobacterium sp. TC5-1 TaxID=1158318 RepID=UPI0003B60F64|nr:hypothetical protein [Desulfurobacterium sp. TC5-1]
MAKEMTAKEFERYSWKKAWIVLAAVFIILFLPWILVWFVKFVHWYAQSFFMWL